ncbi:uncharacterized protein LOC122075459 [Macadamia integrifolia]|uniref:uncharacterized protein LOC122075459 n=1 Tax=Macadamia integrifolia TaxID=60698 RepID=UPI001C4ECE81|nr:uncharacterized protein LOC122075459 [Macadamia integrifolia]XP_042496428.1 uncharacterized protein LOC122075459 [Macadamia integrifolia]
MAVTAKGYLLSRFSSKDLSLLRPLQSPQQTSLFSCHLLLIRPLLPSITLSTTTTTNFSNCKNRSTSPAVLSCLVSGVDGGGVADDFVSTRKAGFDREFSVIASMLKRIEPLDTSVISKGISAAARDSMKRTISTMLGLLPSDQFNVTISVSRRPLDRLLVSSIITGYTLWNAEYRVSLMRSFDISPESSGASVSSHGCGLTEKEYQNREGRDVEVDVDTCSEFGMDRSVPLGLGDLSPEALNYIAGLKSELASIEKELNAQKQENLHLEYDGEGNNDLLEYLRTLEPNMVTELSRPSSSEVGEVIHELVQNILQNLFKDDTSSGFLEDSVRGKTENLSDGDIELCNTIGTSRDYLAKLLFWCMLLGHHLRGLENRLHLSCAVGLL